MARLIIRVPYPFVLAMKAFLTEGFRIPILMFRTFDFADADFSKLAGEVEAYVLEILLCHLQHVA